MRRDLLIAKHEAYGLEAYGLVSIWLMITQVFENKGQKLALHIVTGLMKATNGIPRGSILGPLLFNFFINEIFWTFEKPDICNFVDDNTLPFFRDKSLSSFEESRLWNENPLKMV